MDDDPTTTGLRSAARELARSRARSALTNAFKPEDRLAAIGALLEFDEAEEDRDELNMLRNFAAVISNVTAGDPTAIDPASISKALALLASYYAGRNRPAPWIAQHPIGEQAQRAEERALDDLERGAGLPDAGFDDPGDPDDPDPAGTAEQRRRAGAALARGDAAAMRRTLGGH